MNEPEARVFIYIVKGLYDNVVICFDLEPSYLITLMKCLILEPLIYHGNFLIWLF